MHIEYNIPNMYISRHITYNVSVNSRSAWEVVEARLQLMDRIILPTHLDLKPENKKVLLQKLK